MIVLLIGVADERIHAKQQRDERQAGDVAHRRDAPLGMTHAQPLEPVADQREADRDDDRRLQHVLEHVIQHVVAHLVSQHRFDLLERPALQQVVVQADALGAEQSADVGADPRRLSRLIDDVDVVGRDAVGARHAEDRIADRSDR